MRVLKSDRPECYSKREELKKALYERYVTLHDYGTLIISVNVLTIHYQNVSLVNYCSVNYTAFTK